MNPYNRIQAFCKINKLDKVYEIYIFHKFSEEYESQIANYKKSNSNVDPPTQVIETIKSTLLSDNTLTTSVKLANDFLEDITKEARKNAERKNNIKTFGMNVFSGVLASFIFALLLLGLFAVSQSQVKSWINDFNQSDTKTSYIYEKEPF